MALINDLIQYPFLLKSFVACVLLAGIAGLLSPIVVAKRMAIIGEGIGHSTFLTSTIALWITNFFALTNNDYQQFFWIVLLLTWIMSLFIAYMTMNSKAKTRPIDSFIAAYLSLTLSLGIVLHSKLVNPSISIEDLLFGNILLITQWDIVLLLGMSAAIVFLFLKHFWSIVFYTYDELGAKLCNVPVNRIHFMLMFLLSTFIVCAVKVVGPILVSTMLVLPGLYARNILGDKAKMPFLYSIFHCVFSTILGFILSNYWNIPPGAVITLAHFPLFLLMKRKIKQNN